MSARYEKARAIAEAAANHWDKFQDTAGINWLTDAILAATAVSQPPTSRQGAGEVEALRAALAYFRPHPTANAPVILTPNKMREHLAAIEAVLPAQPGPAPVGDGGAIEALRRTAEGYSQRVCEWDDRTSPEDWPDHLLITARELEDLLIEFAGEPEARAALDSIPAVGGAGWQPDEVNPPEALYAWLLRNYEETDPTKGEAFQPVARKLVAALGEFIEAELPTAPTARDGGE